MKPDRIQCIYLVAGFVFLLLLAATLFDFTYWTFYEENWSVLGLGVLFVAAMVLLSYYGREHYSRDVQSASMMDPISGLPNSVLYERILSAEIERARRMARNLTLVYLDVDYFYRYNQQYGRRAGDGVLDAVGELIRKNTRSYDHGFRMGSDEFAVVYPETTKDQAKSISERVLDSFLKDYKGTLGLSMGIAEWAEGDDADILLKKATTAMNQARRRGGNRITGYVERGELIPGAKKTSV